MDPETYRDGEGNSMSKRDAHRDELIGRLRVLRADIDVIIDHYRMNCISRVEEILRILEHRDIIGDGGVELSVDGIHSMLSLLDELKVKPKKGRLKDLKRVDALLDRLLSQFPTQM
jgi:hypothetical protein